MLSIETYLASFPRKNDSFFEHPCCPRLEQMYSELFGNPQIKFDNQSGNFCVGGKVAARFYRLNLTGGSDWVPNLKTSEPQIILIKNPSSDQNLLELIGVRNGITTIKNRLIALRPILTAMIEVRRPVRQSHLSITSPNLKDQFERYKASWIAKNTNFA